MLRPVGASSAASNQVHQQGSAGKNRRRVALEVRSLDLKRESPFGAGHRRRAEPGLLFLSARLTAYTSSVAETRDKRRRNDLDLFVLALIDSGIATPYDLQRAAGLSQGATVPVLRRLIESGHVRARKAGLRGRTSHAVTAKGKNLLENGWRDLVEAGPSGDLDSDLRVALLALWVAGDHHRASGFLRRVADMKLQDAQGTLDWSTSADLPPLAVWYRNLRSISTAARAGGESVAAREMAKALTGLTGLRRRRRKPRTA